MEFALVLPLVILLMSVAFNGWNGIQLDLRLTGAARAGAIQAANILSGDASQIQAAQDAATSAINREEAVSIYQDSDSSAPNYVGIATTQATAVDRSGIAPQITMNVVTISISQASVTLVPVIGKIGVSAHATAEYS